jgi:hypothetical protein
MSLVFIRPGHAMGLGNNQLALYTPLASGTPSPTSGGSWPTLIQTVSGTAGWWDAGTPEGLLGPGNTPVTVWNSPGGALIDLSGNNQNLIPFFSGTSSSSPVGSPHLSGMLGGVGFPIATPGLLQPALDPGSGWQTPGFATNVTSSWTWYLVWSRPNWRQGTNVNSNPITLITIGSLPILQVDSNGGSGRLILFPGSGQVIVNSSLTRRHTHAIMIRYSAASGIDLWLDSDKVAQAEQWTPGTPSGPVLFLHDGTTFGAAQCWFHEAAGWDRALSDAEVAAVIKYSGRWTLGVRRGLYFIVNGQSNAINYSLNDGAAALLARGVAWYLGALAYNVLATTGSPTSFTMQSGHGIYAVASAGYPGSFIMDPGDGSNPSGWSLGADGLGVQQAVAALAAEDLSDLCAIIWPWNETDSLRQYSELGTFKAAAMRFLLLLRAMLGDTSNRIPLIWWNAIPYGSSDGITMHRQVVQSAASNPAQNIVVGNQQTSDSNARGSSWDPTTGIATGGDSAHRDSADNVRFAILAAPVVARALIAGDYVDSITTLPGVLPKVGGPSIVHVYKQSATTLIVTVVHDAGNDLKVPLQAVMGIGFAVMDGGTPGNDGPIVSAISCQRVDATHFQLGLDAALQKASGACQLFYPYGPLQIGRGNAVTDNFSAVTLPLGWNMGSDLGPAWILDYPLAATFSGMTLSDTPS